MVYKEPNSITMSRAYANFRLLLNDQPDREPWSLATRALMEEGLSPTDALVEELLKLYIKLDLLDKDGNPKEGHDKMANSCWAWISKQHSSDAATGLIVSKKA